MLLSGELVNTDTALHCNKCYILHVCISMCIHYVCMHISQHLNYPLPYICISIIISLSSLYIYNVLSPPPSIHPSIHSSILPPIHPSIHPFIHTTPPHRMLYAYVEHCRSSQDSAPNVIYTITGLMHTDNGKIVSSIDICTRH